MHLADLAKQYLGFQKQGKIFQLKDWPSNFLLESHVSESLKRLSKYTHSNTNKEEGASGWEYEISFLYFIDKIYASDTVAGSYSQVKFSHSFNAKPVQEGEKVKFILSLDKKNYSTPFYDAMIIKDSILFGFIAAFHTHPLYKVSSSEGYYSFFSPADMKSLFSGHSPILGLIAGRNIWLACRTQDSVLPTENQLNSVSLSEKEGITSMENKIKTDFHNNGIAFYSGKLGGKLIRII